MLAVAYATPEIDAMFGDDNAKSLAESMARVADHFGITQLIKVPSHPLVLLALCCWSIYMPMILAIKLRHAAERARNVTPKAPAGLAPPPQTPQAPQPQAPQQAQPQPAPTVQQAPKNPPPASPMVPGNGQVVRAAKIPGLPDLNLDIDITGSAAPVTSRAH